MVLAIYTEASTVRSHHNVANCDDGGKATGISAVLLLFISLWNKPKLSA
jgi:hypothetical protein